MKRARALIPHDLHFDILQRLPAKSILRFGAVCKSWSSLISDPSFLLAHARRAKPSVIFTRYTRSSLDLRLQPVCSTNSNTDSSALAQTTTLEVPYPGLSLLASCDGLLCFQGMPLHIPRCYSPCYYYMCNPLTDQWITLPESGLFVCWSLCAFYYHPSMKEYRLLRNSPYGYEILTIGSKEWRSITCLFDSIPSPILEFCVHYLLPRLEAPPIPMHGKLHYPPTMGTPLVWQIMVFDINSEQVGQMSLPECCRTKECTIDEARLIELEGKLGVFSVVSDAVLDLWMLEDYEKQVWVKRYRIGTTPEREHVTLFKPLVVSDDGGALVDWSGDLVLYDFKHHTRSEVIVDDDFRITNVLYKESLIRLSFFETGYQTGFITSPMSFFHTSSSKLSGVVTEGDTAMGM